MATADEKGFSETIRELWGLLRDYGRQETLEPLRGLARYIGMGIAGSLLLALGFVLILLGGLRLAQEEATETFDGILASAVPYAVGFLICVLIMGLAAFRIGREPKRRV